MGGKRANSGDTPCRPLGTPKLGGDECSGRYGRGLLRAERLGGVWVRLPLADFESESRGQASCGREGGHHEAVICLTGVSQHVVMHLCVWKTVAVFRPPHAIVDKRDVRDAVAMFVTPY
jgi:hypothetical protein